MGANVLELIAEGLNGTAGEANWATEGYDPEILLAVESSMTDELLMGCISGEAFRTSMRELALLNEPHSFGREKGVPD